MKEPKVGVAIIFINDDNKILLGHRIKDNSWGVPGGKLEWKESFEKCAIRESIEEVGLTPIELKYVGINNVYDKEDDHHYITTYYHAVRYKGTCKLNEPDKCKEWDYFSLDKLPKKLFYPLKNYLPKLKEYLNNL